MYVTEGRKFEDGAYYWVKLNGEWSVGVFEAARPGFSANDLWRCLAEDGCFTTEDFDEIGGCIGKEPQRILTFYAPLDEPIREFTLARNGATITLPRGAKLQAVLPHDADYEITTPPAAPASAACPDPAPGAAADR